MLIITIVFSTLAVGHRGKESDRELTIYASLMEEQAIAAVDNFERETGIKTNFIRMSSGEILNK